MQTRKDDRAFPQSFDEHGELGLTKREYFAASALQGYIASGITFNSGAVQRAIKAADQLIYELNETDSRGGGE